jgi:hypothetical protein
MPEPPLVACRCVVPDLAHGFLLRILFLPCFLLLQVSRTPTWQIDTRLKNRPKKCIGSVMTCVNAEVIVPEHSEPAPKRNLTSSNGFSYNDRGPRHRQVIDPFV